MVISTLHIDNYRWLGTFTRTVAAFKNFRRVQLLQRNNRRSHRRGRQGKDAAQFSGYRLRLRVNDSGITKKFVAKLKSSTVAESTTWDEMQTLVGRLFFAAQVLGIGLSGYYYALKQ